MSSVASPPPGADLDPATITARSGSSFLSGFLCLGPERRAGMTAIYAFCRVADDAVDDAPDAATGRRHLAFWRDELQRAAGGEPATQVGRSLQAIMRRFAVPAEPLGALLDGVAMDLERRGIADEAELSLYCDRVASAVGRACLGVLGAASAGAVRYADALGQALQTTNILRDLRTDAEVGRVYVPRTWLGEAGVDPEWLNGRGPADAYRAGGPIDALRRRLIGRARERFAAATDELRRLPLRERRALVPARTMAAVYRALLARLAQRGAGMLLLPRLRVPRRTKLWAALTVWAGVRS